MLHTSIGKVLKLKLIRSAKSKFLHDKINDSRSNNPKKACTLI